MDLINFLLTNEMLLSETRESLINFPSSSHFISFFLLVQCLWLGCECKTKVVERVKNSFSSHHSPLGHSVEMERSKEKTKWSFELVSCWVAIGQVETEKFENGWSDFLLTPRLDNGIDGKWKKKYIICRLLGSGTENKNFENSFHFVWVGKKTSCYFQLMIRFANDENSALFVRSKESTKIHEKWMGAKKKSERIAIWSHSTANLLVVLSSGKMRTRRWSFRNRSEKCLNKVDSDLRERSRTRPMENFITSEIRRNLVAKSFSRVIFDVQLSFNFLHSGISHVDRFARENSSDLIVKFR